MATPSDMPSPQATRGSDHADRHAIPRSRKRSPSIESDRKRYRVSGSSPDGISRSRSYHERPSWEREGYDNSRRISSHHVPSKRGAPFAAPYPTPYDRNRAPARGYENGFGAPQGGVNGGHPMYPPCAGLPQQQPNLQQTAKSRRLYIGNIPFQAGLTDVALTQFFSAMYVAGFRANRPGEPLPVVSFWLHSDGKFGFMELRGEQEAVNMMQFNGVFLHGRPLRVNRPSDYRPELHNPAGLSLVPDAVNIQAVMDLCDQLRGIVSAPAQLAAIAASQASAPTQHQTSSAVTPTGRSSTTAAPLLQPTFLRSQTLSENKLPESRPVPMSSTSDSPVETLAETKGSRVISLRNLVTDQDLEGNEEEYQEILDDVEAECASYGQVQSVNIPRVGPWKGTAFVEYNDSTSANAAVMALCKRVFDGRQIEAVVVEGCQTAAEAANRAPST